MHKIKNLTPHPINLVNADGSMVDIRPEVGCQSPRVELFQTETSFIETDKGTIDFTETTTGEIKNLPEMEDGVILVVSRVVYEAACQREDLMVVGPAIRDGNGAVIGARGLSR